jgi:hypothetical protein
MERLSVVVAQTDQQLAAADTPGHVAYRIVFKFSLIIAQPRRKNVHSSNRLFVGPL